MLTRVLRKVPLNTIDGRSQVGCALRKIKDELVTQMGGPDVVTQVLSYLIDEVAKKIGCAGHLVGGGADRGARPARRRAGRAGPSSLSRGTPPRARTATPEVRAPDLSLSSR
jgi:hypothetical protein